MTARRRRWLWSLGGTAFAVALAVALAAVGFWVLVDGREPDNPPTANSPEAAVACRSGQLELSHQGRVSTSNQTADYFAVKNIDGRCSLQGHPDVELLGPPGEGLDVAVRPGSGYATYDPPSRVVTVADEDDAWFAIASALICHEAEPAHESSALRISLSADDAPIILKAAIPYCPDTQTVTVTSIQRTRAALAPERQAGS